MRHRWSIAEDAVINGLARKGSELRHGARRVARRAVGRDVSANAHLEPPPIPLGGKLEITYACNLRCGFCYTDSPRRTLQRSPELSDDEWIEVADQLIEAGAIEAVVTGGEPLLREDATVEVCRRLAGAGLGVTLNTNGWFIDDRVAARLAEVPGLHVHISIDGPGPELHDASRGVPGSWRRAIGALDALIRHGVAVHVVSVITAANLDGVEPTLEQLRVLGVTSIRVTRVIEIGAAAREGGWRVPTNRLERTVAAFNARYEDVDAVTIQDGEGGAALIRAGRAPGALLVRPNGIVRTDSLNPFSFGHAIDDGLDACWERVREHWRDPEVARWKGSIAAPTDLANADLVAYLDDEVEVGGAQVKPAADPRSAKLPRPAGAGAMAKAAIADPSAHIERLALGRRYRSGEVRAAGAPERRLLRRLSDGRIWRLNRSASIVFDALANGTPADAEARLSEAYPGVAAERLRADALDVTRTFARHGLALPADARAVTFTNVESTPDLPQAVPG